MRCNKTVTISLLFPTLLLADGLETSTGGMPGLGVGGRLGGGGGGGTVWPSFVRN
jgi:hypothetical protein